MKILLRLLIAGALSSAVNAQIYTKENLERRDIGGLLRMYYGDFELSSGLYIDTDPDSLLAREELLFRPDATEAIITALRRGASSDFLYSLLGLAEFGTPSEEEHGFALSEIRKVVERNRTSPLPDIELHSREGMVLIGMGAYLAGRPSAEGEPILLDMLRRANWTAGLPFTLRMVEKHPTPARLEALQSRDYGPESLSEHRQRMRGWVDASIARIQATLKDAKDPQPLPFRDMEPQTGVPTIASGEEILANPGAPEPGSTLKSFSDAELSWFAAVVTALLLFTGVVIWRQRGRA